MANICIVGIWHQGAVLSACLADMGHRICGVESKASVVRRLNQGELPVYEPGLEALVKQNIEAGRLSYTTDYSLGMQNADFVYISIDTPVGDDDRADLGSVYKAARHIAHNLSKKVCLIVTAQVPVGTCEKIAENMAKENPNVEFDIVYVPEFLRLGTAIETFQEADRFVIGAEDPIVAGCVANIYKTLGRPIVMTNLRSAEMAKHASNSFLASSISFVNELSDLCDEAGADAWDVAKIMKLDRRIGQYAFLNPGLGFAGGTLGRDVRAIQAFGRAHDQPTRMMDAIMEVNNLRAELVTRRLLKIYGDLNGLRVGIWGLTYKSGTSTLRRSIALDIIASLVGQGVVVRAYDPLAHLNEVLDLPPFVFCHDPYEAVQDCDALVLVTEWAEIEDVDLNRVCKAMSQPVFIDTKNLFDPFKMRKTGFSYSGIGRGLSVKGELGDTDR